MDYEKKHKEEVVRATQLWECGDITRGNLEYIFPELEERKESENERIMEALIELVKMVDKCPIGQIFGYGDIKYSDMIAWLEKQGEQKSATKVKPKSAWSEEDERLCKCIIEDQEEDLDNVRNDKYGHSEIISDLKDMYRERIDWLNSIKDRVQSKWKPNEEELNALDIAKDRNDKTGWHLCELYKQLKKL